MERLKKIGELSPVSSDKISFSRLGIGFEKLDRDVFDPEKAYDKVAALGVKKIRIQSGWAKTEKRRGIYEFEWLDKIVDNLIMRGLEPWICLCYGNPLYTPLAIPVFGAVGCPPISTEEETAAWLNYVKATVEHFKGRVDLFEIWNEPDCSYSWRHAENEERDRKRNAVEYGTFALKTAKVIKAGGAQAIGFALGHANDLDYLNTALETGLWQYLDYISFHCYTHNEIRRRQYAKQLRRLIDQYAPSIKLIQGETGAQSRSDGHGAMAGFSWTEEKQTKALLRGLIEDLAEGVAFTSYFSTMDMVEALRGRTAEKATYLDYGYFGVLGAEFDENGHSSGTYREKPAYFALRALAALMHGNCEPIGMAWKFDAKKSRRVNGFDCSDPTIRVECFRTQSGSTAMIYWNSVDLLTSTYEGTVSFRVFGQGKKISLIDLRNGAIYALPEEMREDIDGGVLLSNLPITDFPLAILFE